MLFTQKHLEGIKAGAITHAFRRWNKPAVKNGSLLKTSIGVVEVTEIAVSELDGITESDARQAGFKNLAELVTLLNKSLGGHVYRIQIRYHSADPRLELREQTLLTDQELQTLKTKVRRLDQFSKQGDWTLAILKAIGDHPKLKAQDLALKAGKDKAWLKLNIRKLKNLGLTISHEPGYALSPLGNYFLENTLR